MPVRALKEMQGEGSPGRGSDAIRRVVLRCKMTDEQEGWGTWGGTQGGTYLWRSGQLVLQW
jgi:hypothetical protein